jgi:hypothetical protein
MTFIRLPWMVRLVSRIVVTRSRRLSVHSVAQQDQALAQLETAPLQVPVRFVVEQPVFQLLDGVVQFLHRGEVAVHQVVDQAMQQEADSVAGQIGTGVPIVDHAADVQPVVLAHGNQGAGGDERG